MGLEIVLYDASPVTQRIFSHILYHYKPQIHRVDQENQLLEKIQHQKPDIIFIDQSTEKKSSLNLKNKQEFNNIPMVLMSQTLVENKEQNSIKAFLKKPIEAFELRKLVKDFVPKTKTNAIEEYLNFPKLTVPAEKDFIESSVEKTGTPSEKDTNQPSKSITPINIATGGDKTISSTHSSHSSTEQDKDNLQKSIAPVASESTEHKIRLSVDPSQKTAEDHKTDTPEKSSNIDSAKETAISSFHEQTHENTTSQTFTNTDPLTPDHQTNPTIASPPTTDRQQPASPLEENESNQMYSNSQSEGMYADDTSFEKSVEDEKDRKSPKTENITFSVEKESEKLLEKQISQFVNTRAEELLKKKVEQDIKQMLSQLFSTKGEQILEKETKQMIQQLLNTKGEQILEKEVKQMIQQFLNTKGEQILEKEIKQTLPQLTKQLVREELDKLLKIEDDKNVS